MSELTMEQVGQRMNNVIDNGTVADEDYRAIMAHDAAQRAKIAALEQQLAETHAHLDAQRTATYQAVKREHAAGRELALLKDTEKFIKQLAEIRKARHEATASPDTP